MNKLAKIEPKIFDELKIALSSFDQKYFVGEELNRSKLTEDLRNYDETLLSKLFEVEFIKQNFLKEVAGQKLFQIEQLEETIMYNDYWDTSYTKYENRVGLASKGKFLQDDQDVVLDFPFKDGVLTASMTKEDNEEGYDDAFLNEVIEKDEIDRLFDKKIFTNVKRFGYNSSNGVANGDVSFDKEKDNLIIKGNNLLALHTLKDMYSGMIKLIYIDPPYNTGKDSFRYNDKFNHSTWMTFMKNRLEIAKELLSEDGCIWLNIDDDEGHYLKVLADGVFGRENFINNVIWEKKYTISNDAKYLSDNHDHLLFYAKDKNNWKPNPLPRTAEMNKAYKNPDNHPKGVWKATPLHAKSGSIKGERFIHTFSNGVTWSPPIGTFPRFSKVTLERLDMEDAIYFGKDGNAIPSRKTFLSELKNKGIPARTVWRSDEVGHNHEAREEIKHLNLETDFTTPKPERLLQRVLTLGSLEGDIILDFFMGSATTQAVAMKMKRRFIGIEQMDYINSVSIPRLEKVIDGDQGGISKAVNWQGGGSFVYTELLVKNMSYLKDIIHSKTTEELNSVYESMLQGTDTDEPADISFRVDLSKIDWAQGFDDNKRLLIKLLDKNGLYYNYSEIDDMNVRDLVSHEDYSFNKAFYEGGE